MPEIPDLNIFSRNLSKRLVGQKLTEINVVIPRKLKVPETALKEALEGQELTAITREGKELYFIFKNGHVLSVHLMLHGTMYWYEGKNGQRFTIAELLFADGTGLAITDWQKAVILTLDPKPSKVPDAMAMPEGYLVTALKGKSHPIKTALTEGKVVRGIGNAYVDEILYAAGISPFSKADKIPDDKIEMLIKVIPTVLTDAENHISSIFPDTITEKERDFLQVHRPKQKQTLSGEPIKTAEIDKRKTYYTEGQVLYE
ncbi:DNA-formamidopyrimidine glycosylase family protein [Mucilaginibacter sp. BT774]|uniref:DNA-formamidopyrimidine glycosylase family protein n=1 Tax=Mucilaginibacter sp. BT774 TaxID=3062276 RepID=UPI002676774A|nr:DNA-formamidopyrimidine glycosylase family protein [Mucilaginibacter sp. BT774]MDO3627544.1 DNA-formamidopyrimidine glycosylase family protein [Mucilaginibacter sp. BT774]